MADDLETLLRDHYSTSAESIQPSPEFLERARSAARFQAERPRRWWPVILGATVTAAASLVLVLGLAIGHGTGTDPGPPGVPKAPPTDSRSATPQPSREQAPGEAPQRAPRPSATPTPGNPRTTTPSPAHRRPPRGSAGPPSPSEMRSLGLPSSAAP